MASLGGEVLPGKVLKEEGGWGEEGLQGHWLCLLGLSLGLMLGLEVEVPARQQGVPYTWSDREVKTYLTKPPWSGWRAGREGSPATPLQGEQPCTTSLYRGNI